MPDRQDQLDLETQHAAIEELRAQVNRSFEELVSTGHKLTQHNFLVNAGGAAAVLAYMGSAQDAGFAIWPLACFLVGVIATGMELRSLVSSLKAIHEDAIRRWLEFAKGKLDLSDAAPSPDLGRPRPAQKLVELVAQWAFPVGVIFGLGAYLLHDVDLSYWHVR
jgi:hypothetical protein